MLLDKLQSDLASAQKARDQIRVDTLRFLLGAIRNYEIEKYPPSSLGTFGTSEGQVPQTRLTDTDILSVIAKQVKSRKESIEMFVQAKRQDLVDKETAGMKILQAYLPAQMSEEEIRGIISKIKSENPGADFGALMKLCLSEFKGKADGAVVAKILKEV